MTNDLDDPKVNSTYHYYFHLSVGAWGRGHLSRKYVPRVKNLGEGIFSCQSCISFGTCITSTCQGIVLAYNRQNI